ncbi:hypothetical protein G9A89_005989 [Geosiphon pyriformis]|nr:hypothetical protein G9A89_005989 [Geosiphon pyriformis]
MAPTDNIKTNLEWISSLSVDQPVRNIRKTSIICTIGPKTNSVEMIKELRDAGMNIVRMNFSHGSYEYHKSVIDHVRENGRLHPGRPLALALDTKGPEIRTGLMRDNVELPIRAGHEMIFTTDKKYEELCDLKAIRKGVNLPKTEVDLPALSEKDKADLRFGVEQGVDMVFASFIRTGQDIRDIRAIFGEKGKHIKIIAKIENHQGLTNFDAILAETDGVMVARGDLGIEIPASQVFVAQKMMIAKCNIVGKPVVCATQMLESMTYNPRPTRAEVSDVANAVLDGADCVMLSGETAKGAYPIEAVQMMNETCIIAESVICYPPLFNELRALTPLPTQTTETVASSAVSAAHEQNAGCILVLSTSGNTARLVSKYRPRCPIITVTRNAQTARQIHLYRGCYPFIYDVPPQTDNTDDQWQEDVENRIKWGINHAKFLKILQSGDAVIAIQGWKGGLGNTNTLRILVTP